MANTVYDAYMIPDDLPDVFDAFVHPIHSAFLEAFKVLCLTLLFAYVLAIFISWILFRPLEDKFKWTKREQRFLKSLVEDVEEVLESGRQIDITASRFWDSDQRNTGVTVPLNEAERDWVGVTVRQNEAERDWVERTRSVDGSANRCIEKFERLSERRDFPRSYFLVFNNLKLISELRSEMDRVKNEINSHFEAKKISRIDIYGSLERSRSKVISLQDRPLDKHSFVNPTTIISTGLLLTSTIKKLNEITQIPDLMCGMEEQIMSFNLQMKLLLAFLKDLVRPQIESRTEKAWLEEADDIIKKAHNAVTNDRTATQTSWFRSFKNYYARQAFKRDIEYINAGFSDLFKIKRRYDFKSIKRRYPSTSIHRTPQTQTTQHQNLSDEAKKIEGILHLLQQLPDTFEGVSDEVKSVCNELQDVHKLFRDAKEIEGLNNLRIGWLEQISDINHDVQHSVESYMRRSVQQNRQLNMTAEPWLKLFKESERIKHSISLLKISMEVRSIEQRKESSSVVGLEEDIHAVVSQLKTNNFSVVAIVGMKGIGKTTLAKTIYNHRKMRQIFYVHYWVSIRQGANDDELPRYVSNQVMKTRQEQNGSGNEYWIQTLQTFLRGKRYLVVLDNISKEAWDTLKAAFLETTNGSGIVLTTPNKDVALRDDQSSTLCQLRLRTKEESWEIFTQMVQLPPRLTPEDEILEKEKKLLERAEEVVGRCGGLPLAILRVGYLMSGKEVTEQGLTRVLKNISHNQTPWSETLDDNNNDLPLNLKQRFLSYFGLFPRDFRIPARRLVALWVAAGFVEKSIDEKLMQRSIDETLENVAEKFLSELIDRNLIQVVEKKLNGKVWTCCFPSPMREIWLQRYSRSETHTWSQGNSSNRLLAYHFNEDDPSFYRIHDFDDPNSPNLLENQRHPLCILFFDSREGNKTGKDIGNFLRRGIASGRFRELQVLDLERVFRPQLPKSIKELVQLTYLGLRWTCLETVPSSVGELRILQTLDVKHTCIYTLPGSIWKLKNLQHLYLNQHYGGKFLRQPKRICLENLKTLWGAFVDVDSPLKDGLNRSVKLRKLELTIQLTVSQQEPLASWIEKLEEIRFLRLRSIADKGEPQDLLLKPLSNLSHLSNLYLFGRLAEPSIINELPESLTDLTLSSSKLLDDPMPKLEQLCNLKSLCLYFDSYKGTNMVYSSGGFPQLLVLKLWNLEELKEWKVEEGAMPNLRELDVRSCNKLKVPIGLKHLKFAEGIEGQIGDDVITVIP